MTRENHSYPDRLIPLRSLLHSNRILAGQILTLIKKSGISSTEAPVWAARLLAYANQQGLTKPEGVLLVARLFAWPRQPTSERLIQVAQVGHPEIRDFEAAILLWKSDLETLRAGLKSPSRQAAPSGRRVTAPSMLNRREYELADAMIDFGSLKEAASYLRLTILEANFLAADLIAKIRPLESWTPIVTKRAVEKASLGDPLNVAEQKAFDQWLLVTAEKAEAGGNLAEVESFVDLRRGLPASESKKQATAASGPVTRKQESLQARLQEIPELAALTPIQHALIANWLLVGGVTSLVGRTGPARVSTRAIDSALVVARTALRLNDNASLHIALCRRLGCQLHPVPKNMPDPVADIYWVLARHPNIIKTYPSARQLEAVAFRMAGYSFKEAAVHMVIGGSSVGTHQKDAATNMGLNNADQLNSFIAGQTGLPLHAAPEGMPSDARAIHFALATNQDVIAADPSSRELEAVAYRLALYSVSDTAKSMGLGSGHAANNVTVHIGQFAKKFGATDGPELQKKLASRLGLPRYPIPPQMPPQVAQAYTTLTSQDLITGVYKGPRGLQALAYRICGYTGPMTAKLMGLSPDSVSSALDGMAQQLKSKAVTAAPGSTRGSPTPDHPTPTVHSLHRWATTLLNRPLYPVPKGMSPDVSAIYEKLVRHEKIVQIAPTWNELQVLAYAAKSNDEANIAKTSGLAIDTVRRALARFYSELRVNGLAELHGLLNN